MASRATARPRAAALLVRLRAAGFALGAAVLFAPSIVRADSDSLAARAPIARNSAGWETLATGLPEEARLRFLPWFRYDRVDGAVPIVGLAYVSERDPDPLLYGSVGYATGRDRFLARAGFDVPLGDPAWVRAGADVYRKTETEDAWIVDEVENTLFALFARTDYRDWYEATGWDARLSVEPGRDVALEGSVRVQHESSLRTRVRFSVFGEHDRFRPNPPVVAGDEGLMSLSLRVGPPRMPVKGGARGTVAYERAGGPLGRDFDYGRVRATLGAMHRFNRRLLVRGRVTGGSTREGTLPPQKIWHVGGIGTLRAHDYKAFSGDQFFVANAECLVRVRKRFFPFAFLDWGTAWFGRGNLDLQQPGLDGGLGFRINEDPLALTVGRDLRRSDAPLRVGFRIGGTF